MSEKRLDAKNRWRNVVVAFRMSPEEAQELNVKVSLSGLSKQDYLSDFIKQMLPEVKHLLDWDYLLQRSWLVGWMERLKQK